MGDEPLKNGEKKGRDPETGQFVEGYEGGPGRPPGTRNFATDFKAAVRKIAESQGIDDEDVFTALGAQGLKRALTGDYRFWSDLYQRLYGKPPQAVEHSGPGGAPIPTTVKIVPYNPDNDNDT